MKIPQKLSVRSAMGRATALAVTMALVSGACVLGASPAAAAGDPLGVTGLRTDSLVNPLGLGGDAPEFSWQLRSDTRATVQSEYRIVVASTAAGANAGDGDVWDSGWTTSDQSVDVTYAGPALDSATAYFWSVKLRDNHGEESPWSTTASFETALLAASEFSADWIGEADDAATLAKWSNYSLEISASNISGALGVYLRADENASNSYMWQLSVAGSGAALRPHVRTGGGYNSPPNIPIPANYLNGALTSSTPNTFRFDLDGSTITTFVNGNKIDERTDASFARGFVGFRTSGAERGTVHSVKVTTLGDSPETLVDTVFPEGDSTFTAGTQLSAGSVRFGSPESDALLANLGAEPVFRKEFSVDKEVERARLYASALGVYEFRLNGDKVGDLELAPGWTDYDTRVEFQSYDVTDQLEQGDNAIGALLGSGWYSGNLGWFGPNQYGTDPRLLGQLVIDYADGTTETIGTDDSWTTTAGPIVASDLLNGETYNANLAESGWDTADFDDASWLAPTNDDDLATALLVPQLDPPVRITQELTPKSVTEVGAGTWVFDLGQNMVGKVLLKTGGNNGKTVRLRHSEILHKDGSIAPENLRSAKATDYFTPVADGGSQTYTPRFTFHGFRYVEVTGLTGTPTLDTVTGLVEGSDLEFSSSFESSSPMLNQLQSNIVWGQRGNFLSVPTDTPARDERLGWTGDINVFAPTAAFNMYSEEFLRKWMTDMRDAQHANGAYPEVAPQFCTDKAIHDSCGAGSTGWADAGVTVPFVVWQSYGDLGIIRDNWDSMVSYIDYLDTQASGDLRPGYGTWGDWLNLSDPTPGNVLGSAFYAHSVNMMAQMATAIGDDEAAATYAAQFERIRTAYQEAFISPDGTVSGGSQTAYAISIGMELVPDELLTKVGEKLAARVAAKGGHLSTGFLGTPYLLPALSASGQADVAYSLMMSETFPSWGYEVAMGATTMWERWDSLLPDGTPSDLGMNSFNHYAFGAVGDWMYQTIGGISAAEPGYKHSVIAPTPGGGLTSATVSHDSVYGTIASDWTLTGGRLALTVDVPANTTATVKVPAKNVHEVLEGTVSASSAAGVSSVTFASGVATIEVGSGHYAFTANRVAGQFGSTLDGLDAISAELVALDESGKITGDQRANADELVADARAAVLDASAASSTSELDAAEAVHVALAALATLREQSADYGTTLASAIGAVRSDLSALSAGFLGLEATVAVEAAAVYPGDRTTASVALENTGEATVTDVTATLTAENGWRSRATGAADDEPLAPGATSTAAFALRAPAASLGDLPLEGSVSYAFNGSVATIPVTTTVTVESPIALTAAATPVSALPGESVTVPVTLTNASATDVSGRLAIGAIDGSGGAWRLGSASAAVTVPGGGSVENSVVVIAPESVNAGAVALPLRFTVADANWASLALPLSVPLSLDGPGVAGTDHIDLGDQASETAHALTASANSGTNVEAGRTRRYANRTDPNGYFQFEASITAGRPFILQAVETFDQAQHKVYDISVNGTPVAQRDFVRTAGGQGLATYQVLVDDPAVLENDTITVRFQNEPSGAFYDPSLSDVWISPAPADVVAPSVTIGIDGDAGYAGWYTSDVEVSATASDNRSGDVLVESKLGDADWAVVDGPIAVTAEGINSLSVRSTDAADNIGGLEELVIPIDTVAPSVSLQSTTTGVEKRSVAFAASDSASGVDDLRYRVDGGEWIAGEVGKTTEIPVDGVGTHLVEAVADDAAGHRSTDSISVEIGDETGPVVTTTFDTEPVNGWVAEGAALTIAATDPSGVASIEYRLAGSDWADYGDPLVLAAGRYTVSFRATDAEGNTTPAATRQVWVDGEAPVTVPVVTPGADDAGSFALAFEATDAASGVAQTNYRIDGGEWAVFDGSITVTGYGTHDVDFYSVDAVGNGEDEKSTSVSVKDVEALVAYSPPVVSGSARVGKVLSATTGTWNSTGLDYGYQWLRNGVEIAGATASTYTVKTADIGKKLSVRVVASKTGLVAVAATSVATGAVPKVTTAVTVKASKSSVTKGSGVRVTIAVKAASGTPIGNVELYLGGKRVKTLALKNGSVAYTVKLTAKGTAKFAATYGGTSVFLPDTSPSVKVTVK